MEIKDFEVTEPKFEFNFQWLINLFKRILEDVFGFIVEEEKWTK